MTDEWIVSSRFRGPPNSANGGYCAGYMAERLGGSGTVRLKAPVPLEEPLRFERENGADGVRERLRRVSDGSEIAEAWPATLADTAPPLPDAEHLQRLTDAFERPDGNPYAHCFGCGEQREPDDAIRVLAGQLPGSGLSGAIWRARDEFADDDGLLAPRYVWTALDCTSGLAALHLDRSPIITGTMQARLDAPVRTGADYAVLAWPIAKDGRKITTGSAIYGLNGALKAIGRVTWITIQPR